MKKVQLTIFAIFISFTFFAQNDSLTEKEKRKLERPDEVGQFQFGVRTTVSLFDHQAFPGLGYGGQFRIRLGKRLNTEWYCDYIKTDIGGLGFRETGHIGWSVMFYLSETEAKKGNFTPYIIGGHCFDYAKVTSNLFIDPFTLKSNQNSVKRWSTAVQLGFGTNYYVSDKVDISFSAQYMSHIGNELHVDILDGDGEHVHDLDADSHLHHLSINEETSKVLEGHLLMTLSVNFRIFDIAK